MGIAIFSYSRCHVKKLLHLHDMAMTMFKDWIMGVAIHVFPSVVIALFNLYL